MHLFEHLGIPWKAFGVEELHLSREFRDLFGGLWIVLDQTPKLVQFSQTLLVGALCVRRIS